jgi:nitroimidazol reductase NimA-like FMN-containing flavoprotein (pyridoxamine 5'-phosphate oxidase superfamily)
MSQASAFAKRVLTESAFAYFCTTNMRNGPHVVPVFFLFDLTRCHAYFLFSRDSKKVRNLRLHPNVSFSVDVRDHVNPLGNKGVMIQGRAGETDDPAVDMERVKQLFEEKYGWSRSGSFFRDDHDERVLVDVSVRKMSCWQGPTFISCPRFCIASRRRGGVCASSLAGEDHEIRGSSG